MLGWRALLLHTAIPFILHFPLAATPTAASLRRVSSFAVFISRCPINQTASVLTTSFRRFHTRSSAERGSMTVKPTSVGTARSLIPETYHSRCSLSPCPYISTTSTIIFLASRPTKSSPTLVPHRLAHPNPDAA